MYERLWAPWRLDYIKGNDPAEVGAPAEHEWCAGADCQCFLCRAAADGDGGDRDRVNLVLDRGVHSVTVLNRYPYSNCHLLVSPRRHVADLADLTIDESLELASRLARWTVELRDRVQAAGFNVGLNLGQVAGAGVPGHLHWHVVPRWPGDHNFMTVTGDARIIPQSLGAAWELLRGAVS